MVLTGLSSFTTDVDLRPTKSLLVRIDASLDPATGALKWRLTSIDPQTGEPPEDPLVGFLPPNANPPEGEGNVFFSLMPKPGLATGTEIRNQASIVFDANAPIDTPEWLNTVDASAPVSQVDAVEAPACDSPDLTVTWSGADTGSGIESYTVFLSEDGGAFVPWRVATADISSAFAGEAGKTYAFYSTARDFAGNVEDAPLTPDVTYTVCGPTTTSTTTVSTTTLPPACPISGCEDGDSCTVDRCAPEGCQHDTAVGFAAVCSACRGGLAGASCVGAAAPPAIGGKIDHACALHAKALAATKAKRARRLQHRALAALGQAARIARKAAKRQKLPAECAGEIAGILGSVSSSAARR